MPAISPSPLRHLRATIQEKTNLAPPQIYHVPGRWINLNNHPRLVQVNPYAIWLDAIDWILDQPQTQLFGAVHETNGDWSRFAVIYNLLLRNALAFDHDGDGAIDRPNADGFNELGTFVKGILALRYIKQLGCNTIHLLPITSVGQDGSKGDLGSPYAIRNPYQLDINLAESALGLGVEVEFAAFVEAARHLGMRVALEFVFRTSSKDGDWVKEHPEWFYWIDAGIPDRQPNSTDEKAYGMPIFSADEIDEIEAAVNNKRFDALLPPHSAHQEMFLPPPSAKKVAMRQGSWRANYGKRITGRIPGAFADWPPDDPQPPWGDVTYLRLYDHPDYNYIAYNTIRQYSAELAQPQYAVKPLWEKIVNIIPHYQNQFGIDAAMIDMGHALPPPLKQTIIQTARQINPTFAFWDENFTPSPASRVEGYNAIIGSLPFTLLEPASAERFLLDLAANGLPLPIFGAIESHNTPRAVSKMGGERYVKFAGAIAAFLPAIPFLHCGVEFGESVPINTGLGFTPEESAQFPSDKLPLFSSVPFNWTKDATDLTQWWQQTLALRQAHIDLLSDIRPQTIGYTYSENPDIWGIIRYNDDWSVKLALLVNQDMAEEQSVSIGLPSGREKLMDHYTGAYYPLHNGQIQITLAPGQAIWLAL